MTYKLTDTAMLTRLKRSQWSGKRNDPDVARQAEKLTGAESGSGNFDKVLGKSPTLNAIRANYSELYKIHNGITSPWMEGAWRIIANVNIEHHREDTTELMDEIDIWVAKFGNEYDEFIQRAEKRLAGMFKPSDYPPREAVLACWRIDRSYMRLPANDFRVKGCEDFESELVAEAVAREKQNIEALLDDLWSRVYTPLEKVHAMLKDPDRKVYDSVIEQVKGMADLLPSLNITNDPNLTKMAETLKLTFGSVDSTGVKLDPVFRKKTADQADKLLNDIAGFGFTPPVKKDKTENKKSGNDNAVIPMAAD